MLSCWFLMISSQQVFLCPITQTPWMFFFSPGCGGAAGACSAGGVERADAQGPDVRDAERDPEGAVHGAVHGAVETPTDGDADGGPVGL